jgi:hypothetical protein
MIMSGLDTAVESGFGRQCLLDSRACCQTTSDLMLARDRLRFGQRRVGCVKTGQGCIGWVRTASQ